MSKRFAQTVLWAGVTLLALGAVVGGQENQVEQVAMCVEFITTHAGEPDPLDRLWKYLEHATLRGPSADLLARNGLRMGKLETRFRKKFDGILKKLTVVRRIPQRVQMMPGRSQEFNIGPTVTDRTLFVWKSPDSFVGRRYARARFGMELIAAPVSERRCDLAVRPVVRHGPALDKRLDLDALTVATSMEIGQSLVLSPSAGRPVGLGTAFYAGKKSRGRLRTFVVITLTSVHKPETD